MSRQTPSKVTPSRSRKVVDTGDKTTGPSIDGEKIQKKSRSGRTLKPTKKSQNKELVAHLTTLLSLDWEAESPEEEINAFLTQINEPNDEEDPLRILTSRLLRENAADQGEFAFATQLDVEEPETYNKAMSGSHAQEWSQAMKEELEQLEANKTWTLIHKSQIQPGLKPLGGKWVYKVKRDVHGDIARFKARWVVKGYLQQFGVDFDQTFTVVVKPMAFRVLFAIAAFHDLDIDQMDVKTAFLYGLIDQLIYVEQPKGTETKETRDFVCQLHKALYGLKQSPRLWYKRLSNFLLEKLGLQRINANHSIFTTSLGLNRPIISMFVDDIKIIAPKRSGFIEKVKTELVSAFQMVDMGLISFYLGLRVDRNREKKIIKLSQPAYIEKVLRKFFLDQANPTNTPMKESIQLLPNNEGTATEAERERYQGMTGSLMFSMVKTRPDIAFATSVASRYAKNPSHLHIEAVKTILKYLKGFKDRGIVYGGETLDIEGYSDSDWAGDKESRKSTSGYIFMLNGGPVSWYSKKQAIVALSSTEAEYIALTLAAKEATWLRLLLTELGILEANDQHAEINVR